MYSCRVAGDELRLKHTCAGADSKSWAGSGVVVRLCEASEEVALELRGGGGAPRGDHGWVHGRVCVEERHL